jgi:hypothetical protein
MFSAITIGHNSSQASLLRHTNALHIAVYISSNPLSPLSPFLRIHEEERAGNVTLQEDLNADTEQVEINTSF